MLANIIVGVIFTGIIIFAFKKAHNDMKNNKCGGCSGCSKKSKCHK
ncbi:FeoB-associated Cys-rich membrane protein [Oceanirhabdus seepicola]|uniref:FeoB-associated Cys-rich membrane protein n=1 Tax=Oceanirhabdus seepicola TaxID=2828781 RepID=A0A9J6P239_9CLOT|nr:FeoB-associated Cys-rich membrane protein [Oceanirhabdus seepicola]MCM1990671.1 FeoB-associated Cys-rich membrane protein [Oceanirhabdus seepicola]